MRWALRIVPSLLTGESTFLGSPAGDHRAKMRNKVAPTSGGRRPGRVRVQAGTTEAAYAASSREKANLLQVTPMSCGRGGPALVPAHDDLAPVPGARRLSAMRRVALRPG